MNPEIGKTAPNILRNCQEIPDQQKSFHRIFSKKYEGRAKLTQQGKIKIRSNTPYIHIFPYNIIISYII